MLKEILKRKDLICGIGIVSFMFLFMLISLVWTPYGITDMDTGNTFGKMSLSHPFGTDNFGRDILSRIMVGSQLAFFIGCFSVLLGLVIGGLLGSVSGYFGGRVDKIIMRVVDTQMAFPGILIALMLISIFGPSIINLVIALGIMSIPRFARITRSGFLQCKEMEYVKAAQARGAAPFRVMYIHILPNIFSSMAVVSSLSFATAILTEAGLSYLGLGVQPPAPSWGMMLKEAQGFIFNSALYAVGPGIFVSLLVLGFNLLGDGLRDFFDTKI